MSSALKWTMIAAVVAVGLLVLDRALLKLEDLGWIFYRRNKPNFQNAGSVFLEMQAMFEPRARYVIEHKERQEHAEDEDDDGDPPVPGVDPRRP